NRATGETTSAVSHRPILDDEALGTFRRGENVAGVATEKAVHRGIRAEVDFNHTITPKQRVQTASNAEGQATSHITPPRKRLRGAALQLHCTSPLVSSMNAVSRFTSSSRKRISRKPCSISSVGRAL